MVLEATTLGSVHIADEGFDPARWVLVDAEHWLALVDAAEELVGC